MHQNETGIPAFRVLVEKYQHQVFNTCFHFLRNREDAEDVAQEVFVEIYRSLDRYRGDAALSTWIYRIAMNRCMDHLRMKSRKKRNFMLFRQWGNDELEKLNHPTHEHPHYLLEADEREQIMMNAIQQLPERQRIAFTLSKMEGLKQEEVASIMNCTISSVESLLVRAKKTLKEQLMSYFTKNE
jgi:RNA polymerase sigma-70 factor (ECF subfamily)